MCVFFKYLVLKASKFLKSESKYQQYQEEKKLSIDFSKKNKGAWFWLSFPFYFDSPEILKMVFFYHKGDGFRKVGEKIGKPLKTFF